MYRNLLSFVILCCLLTACGISQSDYQTLVEENETLKEEITSLKDQLSSAANENTKLSAMVDELQNGSAILLAKAKNFYESNDFENALSTLDDLIEKHPAAEEASEAKNLKVEYEATKQRIEEERIAEEKRMEEERIAEEKRLEEEKAKRTAAATANMRTSHDEVKEVTFYYDKSTSQYVNVNEFSAYFGKEKDGAPSLRMRIRYTGDDWLFIESYIFKVDDETITYTPRYSNFVRDNSGGEVWEFVDMLVFSKEYSIIKKVINSKKTIIRHQGDVYYHDRTVTDKEKEALQRVLDAYEALGGKTKFL